jgi:hypothetical protein
MLPILHHQYDTIVIGPFKDIPHIKDVVLYRRENGAFVLHRIVGTEKNGDFILCGDNQTELENHVRRQQMIGLLQAFTYKGRLIPCTFLGYRAYMYLLPALRCIRQGLFWCRERAVAIKHLINVSRYRKR